MKIILFFLIFFSLLINIEAKPKKHYIPEKLKKYFNDNYPNAKKVRWNKYKEVNSMNRYVYEVSFDNERKLYTALYLRSNGYLVSKEEEITLNETPTSIVDTLNKHKIRLRHIIKIWNYDNFTYYDVEGDSKNRFYQLYLTSDGTILEKYEERKNLIIKYFLIGIVAVFFITI